MRCLTRSNAFRSYGRDVEAMDEPAADLEPPDGLHVPLVGMESAEYIQAVALLPLRLEAAVRPEEFPIRPRAQRHHLAVVGEHRRSGEGREERVTVAVPDGNDHRPYHGIRQ